MASVAVVPLRSRLGEIEARYRCARSRSRSDRAAQFIVGAVRKGLPEGSIIRAAAINGLPGLVAYAPNGAVQTVAFEIVDERIRGVYAVSNPEKLSHVVPLA